MAYHGIRACANAQDTHFLFFVFHSYMYNSLCATRHFANITPVALRQQQQQQHQKYNLMHMNIMLMYNEIIGANTIKCDEYNIERGADVLSSS